MSVLSLTLTPEKRDLQIWREKFKLIFIFLKGSFPQKYTTGRSPYLAQVVVRASVSGGGMDIGPDGIIETPRRHS